MQFDFGQNWKNFSERRLDRTKIEQAEEDFRELTRDVPLDGCSFLDIGFGQGLSLLIAHREGARVTGMDINPKCAEVIEKNKARLGVTEPVETVVGSILNPQDVRRLGGRTFDIVHSWGVLHHTGDMYRALDQAAELVASGGHLILALYNRHWSSRTWRVIKWLYCKAPPIVQQILIGLFYPIIAGAKWVVTRKNPFSMSRGMDFYYNVVDWVGGYPYEYASIDEIQKFFEKRGFLLVKALPGKVPTGCNEFVFKRND